jgi:hypothetical protein
MAVKPRHFKKVDAEGTFFREVEAYLPSSKKNEGAHVEEVRPEA